MSSRIAIVVLAALSALVALAQERAPLRLVNAIPLPSVQGRLDHMDVDVKGQRLFIAGLENGSVEVVDLRARKWIRSIPGFKKPQGIVYVPALSKLYVTSGDDGMLRVFHGDTLAPLASIHLDLGPNRLIYDAHREYVYVGYGGAEAGKDYGEIGIIDASDDKQLAAIKVAAHPAELLLDASGRRLLVFVSIADQIQIVETEKRLIVSAWPVSAHRPGDAAFDESTHRLFIGTRTPPKMIVMDSDSGKEVADFPAAAGMDGVYYDTRRKRIYVSGGRGLEKGAVFIYQQHDRDHYSFVREVPTRAGAGTSLWVEELNRYFVAAPANGTEKAAVLVYQPQ